MKIIYIANTRLPTEKAHGLATMKICEAFVRAGAELELVAPKLWRQASDPFSFYNVSPNFKIKKIFCFDLMSILPFRFLEPITFLLQIFSFSFFAALFVLIRRASERTEAVFFSHDYIPLFFTSFVSPKIFYDIHHFPGKNFMYRRVMKKSFGFATQTRWKVEALRKEFGISADKIIYWPNGTDVDKFSAVISKEEARKKLGIPIDNKIIVYTGALFNWKGVDTLVKTIDQLSPEAKIYIVGGATIDVENLKKHLPEANNSRIIFVPFQPHEVMPFWCKAADVLVLPNTGKQKVSLYYTSPMKLFEYIVSGTPLVASNIPSITEIINEDSAFLAEADSPGSFVKQITYALLNTEEAREKSARALEKGKLYTWSNRAQKILALLENTTKPKPPKICFVAHNVSPYNGGGVLSRNIISRLKIALPASAQVLTAETSGFPGELPLLSKRWFLSPFKIFSILKAIRSADFIHAFDVFPYGFIAALFSLGSKARLIITANGTGAIRYLYLPLIYPLAKFAYRRADRIIAISQFTKNEILKRVPGLSISVINPGLDLNIFATPPQEKLLAETKKFQPYILSVGSIRYRKGYRQSIRAFKKVLKVFPDLHYIIIGKKYTDKEYNLLKNLIAELDLKEKVFFVENVCTDEELAAFYHGAKLFCLMSFNVGHDIEGFGIVFTEAAAAGLPVVGSKNCGVEDSVKDGKNGFLVAEDDVEGFADAIIKILKGKELYEKMSANSKNFSGQFSWDKKIDEYINSCYSA
mgnify:CR=1 FL=1